MGSTSKMGAGTNVQDKLIALHHLDCAWKPSDLTQRNGRMIRQGNENEKVFVYSYVTEKTFDSYMYQLVEQKQKFISQIMTSKTPARTMEDIDDKALTYGEIKALATGNPKILEKTSLDTDVAKLRLLKQEFMNQKYSLQDKIIKYFPEEIARLNNKIGAMEEDIIKLQEYTRPNADGFSPMKINGITYTEKQEAGKSLLQSINDLKSMETREIGEYKGFKMEISFDSITRNIRLKLKNKFSYSIDLGTDVNGNITRINNCLENIAKDIPHERDLLDNTYFQLENAKQEAQKEFPKEQELQEKLRKLEEINAELKINEDDHEMLGDEKEEKQDYCSKCEKFLSDREIVGICKNCGGTAKGDQCDNCFASLEPSDILDKKCSTCGSSPILKNNKHLYLALSRFQNEIQNFIDDRAPIWRKNALNESRKFLSMGLIDRATTRQLDWGIEVPVDGYEDKRIYVWIEAVLGYITTAERVLEERKQDFYSFITDPNLISYYSIGKDNIPFHTIIYPAILKSIDTKFQLPTYIISCEFMNMQDEKMSKSKGNLITINDLIDEFGASTVRYFMISNGPEKKDTNFSKGELIQVHNKFLVGVLGNFINRNLSFINKKFDGHIKEGIVDDEIISLTRNTYNEASSLIEKGELRAALDLIMNYVVLGNKYYDSKAPWLQVKENIDEFNNTTYTCIYMIANISNLLNPFIPDTTEKIKKMLSLNIDASYDEIVLKGDIKLSNIELLFNRIDEEL